MCSCVASSCLGTQGFELVKRVDVLEKSGIPESTEKN